MNAIPPVSARDADLSRMPSTQATHHITPPAAQSALSEGPNRDLKPAAATHSITSHQNSVGASNPLYTAPSDRDRPPITQTLPARQVFHETQAIVRSLASTVRTEEELEALLEKLNNISCVARRLPSARC